MTDVRLKCPQCQTLVVIGAVHCPQCDTPLAQAERVSIAPRTTAASQRPAGVFFSISKLVLAIGAIAMAWMALDPPWMSSFQLYRTSAWYHRFQGYYPIWSGPRVFYHDFAGAVVEPHIDMTRLLVQEGAALALTVAAVALAKSRL